MQDQAASGGDPKEAHQHVPLAQAGDGEGWYDSDDGDDGGKNDGDGEGAGVEGVATLCNDGSRNNLENKDFVIETSVILEKSTIPVKMLRAQKLWD